MSLQPTKAQAVAALWKKGIISWKLHAAQKDLYDLYHATEEKVMVWSCSRRLGKSYCLVIIALEQCLRVPNSIVKIVAPTQKHIKSILRPIFIQILEDCPKEVRPMFRTNDNVYRFKNGSEVQLAGTDSGHADALRGGSAHICMVDEAAFCDNLQNVVQSILLPTTTTTNGKVILASTPAVTPGHDFNDFFTKDAKFRNAYVQKTLYDNPMLSEKTIQEIIDSYPEKDKDPNFRREYLCEVIVDQNFAIVPEFLPVKEKIVREWPIPPFRDRYVAGDIGFKDLTVFLFAYFDFKNNKLVIEDELVMRGQKMTTENLANSIKEREAALWTNPHGELEAPYVRVCDNNLIVINDLYQIHKLNFLPTLKDDAEAALNQVRLKIQSESIIIHPRCTTLIFHLENGVWNRSKKSYERSPDAGHYDAVDALKYLVRNVQFNKNPFPAGYGEISWGDRFEGTSSAEASAMAQAMKNTFSVRPSLSSKEPHAPAKTEKMRFLGKLQAGRRINK